MNWIQALLIVSALSLLVYLLRSRRSAMKLTLRLRGNDGLGPLEKRKTCPKRGLVDQAAVVQSFGIAARDAHRSPG